MSCLPEHATVVSRLLSFLPPLPTPASLFAMLMASVLPLLPVYSPVAAEPEQAVATLQVEEGVFLGVLPRHLRSVDALQSFALVIDLRYPYEGVYDEMGALRARGIAHVNLPTSSHGPEQHTVDALKQLLAQHREDRVLIHDSTGYRTAMIWAAYRVDAGADPAAAIEEVRGFANDPGLAPVIQRYAELRSARPSG